MSGGMMMVAIVRAHAGLAPGQPVRREHVRAAVLASLRERVR